MSADVSNAFGRLPGRIKELSTRVLPWLFLSSLAAAVLHYRDQVTQVMTPVLCRVICLAKAIPIAIIVILCVGALGSASSLLPRMLRFIRRMWNSWRGGIPVGLTTTWLACLTAMFLAMIEHRWLGSMLAVGFALTVTACVLLAGVLKLPVSVAALGETDPDMPISAWDEDILGRRPLIDILASTVLLDRPSVLAVSAPFGDGKSSILNLLELELKDEKSILVVRFSSWLPGSQEALVISLFKAVIDAYGRQLFVPSLRSRLIEYSRMLSGLIPKVGGAIKEVLRLPTQHNQFEILKRQIASLPIRVVALIDDVDRMQTDEFESLLKVIRGAFEFPNLTYVCALDYEGICRRELRPGMSDAQVREYLEKFFPIRIALPKISSEVLAQEFDKRFERLCHKFSLLKTEAEQTEFNNEFGPLWRLHVRQNLDNLRRLKLYFNRVSSCLGPIAREINLFDFMLLELIRDTSPEFYEAIYLNPGHFCYLSWDMETWAERLTIDDSKLKPKIKKFVLDFMDKSGLAEEKNELLRELASRLFPLVGEALGKHTTHRSEDQSEKERRVCHPLYFPRYFTLGVPSKQYSEEELASFLRGMNKLTSIERSKEGFLKEFNRITDEIKRWRFLDKIVNSVESFDPPQIRGIVEGIAEVSSRLGDSFMGIGEWDRARALLFICAKRFEGRTEIQSVLVDAVSKASSNGFSSDIIFFCENKERNNVIRDWTFVDIPALREAFVKRMEARYPGTSNGTAPALLDGEARHVLPALFRWASFSDTSRAKVRDLMLSEIEVEPQRLGKLLSWFFGKSMAVTMDTLSSLEKLLSGEEIETLLQKYGDDALAGPDDKKASQRFRAARNPKAREMTPDIEEDLGAG